MKTLCVIFGGVSCEHEVSLRSAASVLENVDRQKYTVLTLGITKDGRWLLYDGPCELIKTGEGERSGQTSPAIISPDRSHGGILVFGKSGRTCSFPGGRGRFSCSSWCCSYAACTQCRKG